MRRLVVDIAAARPAVLRRRAKDKSTAAALCWLVARHNDLLAPGQKIESRALLGHFGVSSVSGRAHTLRSALTRPANLWSHETLGNARYLLGSYRAHLIARRDAGAD